jgi:predicted ArsR family transcriptional regulator
LSFPAQVADLGELRNTSVVKKTEPDARTRDQVARAILETGPATAADLAARLEMTAAGIRRHLDALVADGILTSREPYQSTAVRGRGRPARVFLMTDDGRASFEHSYDDLAVSALKFIASHDNNLSIKSFADQRAQEMEARARTKVSATASITEKSAALADFLTEEGFASDVTSGPIGDQICQHHCPVAHVATQFPELCEAETAAISRILGTHVQRLATIAHGDGVCTTFIPNLSSEKTTTGAHK